LNKKICKSPFMAVNHILFKKNAFWEMYLSGALILFLFHFFKGWIFALAFFVVSLAMVLEFSQIMTWTRDYKKSLLENVEENAKRASLFRYFFEPSLAYRLYLGVMVSGLSAVIFYVAFVLHQSAEQYLSIGKDLYGQSMYFITYVLAGWFFFVILFFLPVFVVASFTKDKHYPYMIGRVYFPVIWLLFLRGSNRYLYISIFLFAVAVFLGFVSFVTAQEFFPLFLLSFALYVWILSLAVGYSVFAISHNIRLARGPEWGILKKYKYLVRNEFDSFCWGEENCECQNPAKPSAS